MISGEHFAVLLLKIGSMAPEGLMKIQFLISHKKFLNSPLQQHFFSTCTYFLTKTTSGVVEVVNKCLCINPKEKSLVYFSFFMRHRADHIQCVRPDSSPYKQRNDWNILKKKVLRSVTWKTCELLDSVKKYRF